MHDISQDDIVTLDEKKLIPVIKAGISTILGTREIQQDTVFYSNSNDLYIAAVFDGMGGMNSGEIASRTAAKILERDFYQVDKTDDITEFLIYEARKIDMTISELKNDDGVNLEAGTTMAIIVICGQNVYWASVGDSKIFYIRDGRIFPLTREHNYRLSLNILRRRGLISEKDYLAELENGEALISYLGIGNLSLIDTNTDTITLQRGDSILLCSDGLYRSIDEDEMLYIIQKYKNIQDAANALTDYSSEKSNDGQDNTSVILMQYS